MTDDDPRHGTTNGYGNLKCRCPRCRVAWNRYTQQRKFERGILLEQNPDIVEHGKASTYGNWRCRCRPCTTAWSEKNRRSR